jgi:hypothetical protein
VAGADPTVERERISGTRPNGTVTLRDFDQGFVETLGGQVINNQYYVTIEGVTPPSGEPGIPVHFFFGEDLFTNLRYPCFLVLRDDVAISHMRLHPFMQQYRAPAKTALPVTVPVGPNRTGSYFDRTVQREQATPYDITYTLQIYNTLRGGHGGRRAANAMLDHVLRLWPVYGQVFVKDSTGDLRSYEAFNEGMVNLDDNFGISERVIMFAVTIRVEAEYDLLPELESRTVTSHPTTGFVQKRITR